MMTGSGRIQTDAENIMPILGSIRIGEKNEKGYPQSLDYFIATGKYAGLFHAAYGDKPKKIQIIFISDNYAESCYEYYDARDKHGRLLAEGDGKMWRIWNAHIQQYERVETDIQDITHDFGLPKVTLTLKFILPKVPGILGIWKFTTQGSASSVPALRSSFDTVQRMAGTVVNIPFDLAVEKVKSTKPDSKSVFPVVSLIANLSPQNLEILAEFKEEGLKLRRVITDDRIEELDKRLQLEAPKETKMYPKESLDKMYGQPTGDTHQMPSGLVLSEEGALHKMAENIQTYAGGQNVVMMDEAVVVTEDDLKKLDLHYPKELEVARQKFEDRLPQEKKDEWNAAEQLAEIAKAEIIKNEPYSDPENIKITPPDKPKPHPKYLTKKEATELWKLAQSQGWTVADAKLFLQKNGIDTFDKMPWDSYGSVRSSFMDAETLKIIQKERKKIEEEKPKEPQEEKLL